MPSFSINKDKKEMVSIEVRGSYVGILEQKDLPGSTPDKPKKCYGMQLVWPKDAKDCDEFVKALKSMFVHILVDKHGEAKAKKMAKVCQVPLRDGDAEDKDALEGMYFMNANNHFRQPYIIGPMGKPVDPSTLTESDIYSGAWYRCMLRFYWYDNVTKGVGVSLEGIMKVRDDTNLGATVTQAEATNAFADFASEAADIMSEAGEESDGGGDEPSSSDADEGFNFM